MCGNLLRGVMKTRFVRTSEVRKFVRDHGKRCSPEFISQLDAHIQTRLSRAVLTHNGSKKTLTAVMADFVFGVLK